MHAHRSRLSPVLVTPCRLNTIVAARGLATKVQHRGGHHGRQHRQQGHVVRGPATRQHNEILPLVEAEADEAERLYHLTDRLVAEFRRKGLYTLLTPKVLGGAEMPFRRGDGARRTGGRVDGSAGWCMMVEGVMGASLGSFLPDHGARTVFPNGADVTMAGNGVPRGFARPVDGGYHDPRPLGLWQRHLSRRVDPLRLLRHGRREDEAERRMARPRSCCASTPRARSSSKAIGTCSGCAAPAATTTRSRSPNSSSPRT